MIGKILKKSNPFWNIRPLWLAMIFKFKLEYLILKVGIIIYQLLCVVCHCFPFRFTSYDLLVLKIDHRVCFLQGNIGLESFIHQWCFDFLLSYKIQENQRCEDNHLACSEILAQFARDHLRLPVTHLTSELFHTKNRYLNGLMPPCISFTVMSLICTMEGHVQLLLLWQILIVRKPLNHNQLITFQKLQIIHLGQISMCI